MKNWGRGLPSSLVLAIGLLVSLCCFACASSNVAAPKAPQARSAVEQIPVDLDVVLRLDLKRMKEALPPEVEENLHALIPETSNAVSDLVNAALVQTDRLWVGFRPSANPKHWDNVVVLEGDFSAISLKEINHGFRPGRDLGGGYWVHDVWNPGSRLAPARLYRFKEERWIWASAAEVDALERVIEGGRFERTLEPPARGVLSFSARVGRLTEELEASSPKAAEFLEEARNVSGFLELGAQGVEFSARMSFTSEEKAERAAAALRLLGLLFLRNYAEGTELLSESELNELSLSLKLSSETLVTLLGTQ